MADNGEEYKGHTKEYMIIFFALGLLTALELFVPNLESFEKFGKGVILTILAVVKAFAVAYYYMHLKEEKAWLKFIALIPISAAAYAFFLCLEGVYREVNF
jgi:cytochrome c oxidase subunit 4